MKHIGLLPWEFDVRAAREELAACTAWNKYPWRTENPKSPHREVSDIWVRYNRIENLGPGFNDPHESVWYPVIDELPAIRVLAEDLASKVHAGSMGGVLVTKIPPGKEVYPHVDFGWHALYYGKYAIQIEGDKDQAFCFEDGALSPKTGDSFWFDNQYSHSVVNQSDHDRITLIVCLRIH